MLFDSPRPDPIIVEASRKFFFDEVYRTELALVSAERKLEEAEARYEENENWNQTRALGEAEAVHERARRAHRANLRKLAWEERRAWTRRSEPDRFAVKPWEATPNSWLNIFKCRKPNPPAPNQ